MAQVYKESHIKKVQPKKRLHLLFVEVMRIKSVNK